MQDGLVSVVRAEGLERLVRGRQGVEERAVVDDLHPYADRRAAASTRLSTGRIGAQSASRLRAPKKIVTGPDSVPVRRSRRRQSGDLVGEDHDVGIIGPERLGHDVG